MTPIFIHQDYQSVLIELPVSLLLSLFFAEELSKVFCNTINTELIKIIKTNKKVKTSNNKNQTTKNIYIL